jgi:hypothetical protein
VWDQQEREETKLLMRHLCGLSNSYFLGSFAFTAGVVDILEHFTIWWNVLPLSVPKKPITFLCFLTLPALKVFFWEESKKKGIDLLVVKVR